MGEINSYRLPTGKFRAVAYYRDFDGTTRQVERVGSSEIAAKNRLRMACRDRGRTDTAAEIGPDTLLSALAESWHSEVVAAVASGERSPLTAERYRYQIDSHVIPGLGRLRLRELSVSRVDRLVKTVRDKHGAATAKATRSVLSGMLGLAARHDAITTNPVRDVAPIREAQKERHSLTVPEVWDLRARIVADQRAIDLDLPDFIDMMLATGLRIGETSAITWSALDLDLGTVEVRGTVIRVKGEGLRIKPKPKSRAGWRTVELPSWAVVMLQRRRSEWVENEWGSVFTSPAGHLRDPSNTQADLREAFDRAGRTDITSHTFRRTVATLMDMAGLSARAAADQLGHSKVSMTQDSYFGRRVAATGARAVLEGLQAPGIEPATGKHGVNPGSQPIVDHPNGSELGV